MKTIKKEKNRELQNECGGVTNSTLSGEKSAKRQKYGMKFCRYVCEL